MAHNQPQNHRNSETEEYLLSPRRPAPKNDLIRATEQRPPSRPRIHFKRTFVLLVVPLAVTGYYYFIWQKFLLRKHDSFINYGIQSELWVFYSWFIIGVLAIEWSKYGFLGVEASMLQRSLFHVPHMAGLLFHSGGTWSGPGGWLDSFFLFFKSPGAKSRGLRAFSSAFKYKLWYLLTFLSLCLYVGLPISGLTMELSDGYVPLDTAAEVVGAKFDNIHSKIWSRYQGIITRLWAGGSPPSVPGFGVIYTPSHVNRDDYEGLKQLPNTMPSLDALADMFIAPQGLLPVSGTAWGLRLAYNCTIVESKSEFKLFLQNQNLDYNASWLDGYVTVKAENTEWAKAIEETNLEAYIEIGHYDTRNGVVEKTYDGTEPDTFDAQEIFDGETIEYALWQVRKAPSYNTSKEFNSTLSPVIHDMESPIIKADNGSWVYNAEYLEHRWGIKADTIKSELSDLSTKWYNMVEVAKPIGVRCVAVSTTGIADLDPGTSTFRSFQKVSPLSYTDPVYADLPPELPVPRLGISVLDILKTNYVNIFSSINSRSMSPLSNSVVYNGFVTPEDLRQSVMRAYGFEALQIMYNGNYGFEGKWANENLTSSEAGKVITLGPVPPIVSVVLLGIWTLGSFSLAIVYGFRRRRSESLDGLSFFRLGAYYSPDLGAQSKLYNSREASEIAKAWRLPGHGGGEGF